MRLLIDLDNTLVDRAGAFRLWAEQSFDDADWVLAADRNGYTPRAELAAAIIDRFALAVDVDAMVERLLFEHVPLVAPYPGVLDLLGSMDVVVVTNGTIAQQEAKLRTVGLERYVGTAVISERLGIKKPDPEMFLTALGETDPADAWMVGDHPEADIAGARAVGIRTAWVSHGRAWPFGWQPDVVATTTVEALRAIVLERPATR